MIMRTFGIDQDWVGSEADLLVQANRGQIDRGVIPGMLDYMERIHGHRMDSPESRTERFVKFVIAAQAARRFDRIAEHLANQADAVDVLLSYFPRRRRPLSEARLVEIELALRGALPTDVRLNVEPEDSPDLLSCHRLLVSVPLHLAHDAEVLFDQAVERLVNSVSAEEKPSISLDLVVEG